MLIPVGLVFAAVDCITTDGCVDGYIHIREDDELIGNILDGEIDLSAEADEGWFECAPPLFHLGGTGFAGLGWRGFQKHH